jgi:hypothetical protein
VCQPIIDVESKPFPYAFVCARMIEVVEPLEGASVYLYREGAAMHSCNINQRLPLNGGSRWMCIHSLTMAISVVDRGSREALPNFGAIKLRCA